MLVSVIPHKHKPTHTVASERHLIHITDASHTLCRIFRMKRIPDRCWCANGTSCVRVDDDLAISAYVYRCRTGLEAEGKEVMPPRPVDPSRIIMTNEAA